MVFIIRRLPSIKDQGRTANINVAASLNTTSSGIPLVPGTYSPEPTEDSLSLMSSQRSSITQQSESEQTVAEPLNKEIENVQKSQGEIKFHSIHSSYTGLGAAGTSEQTPLLSTVEQTSDSQASVEEEMYSEDQTPDDDQLEVETGSTQELTES